MSTLSLAMNTPVRPLAPQALSPTGAASPGSAPQAPSSTAQAPPADPQGAPASRKPVDQTLNSAVVNKILSEGINKGETVTIRGTDGEVMSISRKGVSTFDKIKSEAADLFRATAAEASNIVAQDPAFAFKEAAFAVQTQVFSGISSEITSVAAQGFVPMVRVVSFALDAKKAIDNWKAQHTTHVDRAIMGGHLVTDIAGLGGAAALFMPGIGHTVGFTLSVVGLMGDVAAYGYHVMKYFKERGKEFAPPTAVGAARPATPPPPPSPKPARP